MNCIDARLAGDEFDVEIVERRRPGLTRDRLFASDQREALRIDGVDLVRPRVARAVSIAVGQ